MKMLSLRPPTAGLVALAACLFVAACSGGGGGSGSSSSASASEPVSTHSGSIARQWFELQLQLVSQSPGFSPPVASRAMAYSGVALYEALVGGMEDHLSLGSQLNGLTPPPASDPELGYDWPTVANATLAEVTRQLYPVAPTALQTAIDDLEAQVSGDRLALVDAAVHARSVDHGRAVATWILAWSQNDGARYGYLTNTSPGYVPPVGTGLWEPTPPAYAPALQAEWGNNRCFVLESGASCQPGPPPEYSTAPGSAFHDEAMEVYTTVNDLSAEQLEIAQFWSDDPGQTPTPPGHWLSILNQVVASQDYDLEVCVEAYCRLGLAVADAFISCWYAKFDHNLVRPLTYIHQHIDAQWTIPLVTPPFPEYTSGHSVQSGAAATVLTDLLGDDLAFTDGTHLPNLPARTYPNFEAAAQEAAISRLYGGIHYRAAIDNGVEQGRAVGRAVNALRFRKSAAAPVSGAPVSASTNEVATGWYALQLDLVKTTSGFTPPVASRAFGYSGVALWEALAPGIDGHRSLAGQLRALTPLPPPEPGASYHWPAVANATLARMQRLLFANTTAQNLANIDSREQGLHDQYALEVTAEVLERSEKRGREVADAVFFWSRNDGGHEGYDRNFPSSYVPPVGPGLWVPTPPAFQSALQPYWGDNRTFALSSGADCPPGPPPPYSETVGSEFHVQALEVYDAVNALTADQLAIANWWADDPGVTATPPGHSIAMLTQVLLEQGSSLDVAAEGYARVGLGIADAFISCWHSKYRYDLVRPITYINALIDANWSTPVGTPPFPEYTSGHSVQSGAWAEVMTALFGDGYVFTDMTNVSLGYAPRSFSSFYDAADEAAISRLYGGIHYRAAIDIGVQQGRCVGQRINALIFREP